MDGSPRLRCVIAAGGTAGHVRPALAVAEALRERGVSVTFAGSPDRVESQLVPEAGFELDTFAISGFPRRLGLGLVRALWQAVRAPFACGRILSRRQPDVVLGGGGYVAGPMVLAARTAGAFPAALTRGRRPPRAREPAGGAVRAARLPRVRDRGARRRRSTASSAARSRRRTWAPRRRKRGPRFGLPQTTSGARRVRRARRARRR